VIIVVAYLVVKRLKEQMSLHRLSWYDYVYHHSAEERLRADTGSDV